MTTTRPRRRIAALALAFLLAAALPALALVGGGATEITQILNVAENALSAVENALTASETAKAVIELGNQIDQDLDKAMGRIGALTERFEALSSDPMRLLENAQGIDWADDFAGEPRELLNAASEMQDPGGASLLDYTRRALAEADTVSRERYVRTFGNVPDAAQHWEARRERAERALVADYLVLDSAEKTIELLGSAADSIERSRQQTELSETALAQEQRANQLTAAEVDIAVAQLLAHHATRNVIEQYSLELEHRAITEAWIDALVEERQQARRAQNRVRRSGNDFTRALLLN